MTQKTIRFDKLIPDTRQIELLYELLNEREHRISHTQAVSFEDHAGFVKNNPYRAWYLVDVNGVAVGSFYVSNENTIGINIEACRDDDVVRKILSHVEDNYDPLDAIPSVRSGVFSINVAPRNEFLLSALKRLGAEVVQLTYQLPTRQD